MIFKFKNKQQETPKLFQKKNKIKQKQMGTS